MWLCVMVIVLRLHCGDCFEAAFRRFVSMVLHVFLTGNSDFHYISNVRELFGWVQAHLTVHVLVLGNTVACD